MNWAYHFRYKARGFYYAHLRSYFDCFPREQIRIYLYEEWAFNLQAVLRDIFRFLEVDDTFQPRRHTFQAILNNPHPLKNVLKPLLPRVMRRSILTILQSLTNPPPLDPELHRQLTEEYRDDIIKLQSLIGRDLSHWLDPKRGG